MFWALVHVGVATTRATAAASNVIREFQKTHFI
jgi:hypothetical protein